MAEFSVNGTSIHYQDSGSGLPVVQVHGYTGNQNNWAAANAALGGRYRTIALDLPGHGRSGVRAGPEGYDLDLLAGDVRLLLEHLGVGSCVLMGHSMGGMVAQHFAVAHPGLLRGLVLVDTAATLPKLPRVQERQRLLAIALEQGMESAFAAQLEMFPPSQRLLENPHLIDSWRQEFLMTSREAYVYCAQAIAQRRPLLDELAAVAAPTLIIVGEHDEPFIEPSQVMHQRINGSRLVTMAGCNHAPFVEKPADFAGVIVDFLAQVESGIAERA